MPIFTHCALSTEDLASSVSVYSIPLHMPMLAGLWREVVELDLAACTA